MIDGTNSRNLSIVEGAATAPPYGAFQVKMELYKFYSTTTQGVHPVVKQTAILRYNIYMLLC